MRSPTVVADDGKVRAFQPLYGQCPAEIYWHGVHVLFATPNRNLGLFNHNWANDIKMKRSSYILGFLGLMQLGAFKPCQFLTVRPIAFGGRKRLPTTRETLHKTGCHEIPALRQGHQT